MRDVKEVHTTVCRHVPSAFLCETKGGGGWTYESEVSFPGIRRISAMSGKECGVYWQEAVRPDPAAILAEEYRLTLGVLPLHVRLDQPLLDFLNAFFASPFSRAEPPAATAAAAAATATTVLPFIQRVQVWTKTSRSSDHYHREARFSDVVTSKCVVFRCFSHHNISNRPLNFPSFGEAGAVGR